MFNLTTTVNHVEWFSIRKRVKGVGWTWKGHVEAKD